MIDHPTALHYRTDRFGRFGQGQEYRKGFHERVHALDGPDDTAQHHDRQEASHRHVHRGSFAVNRTRDNEPWTGENRLNREISRTSRSLTKAHSAQSGQHGHQHYRCELPAKRNVKHVKAEHDHHRRLDEHDQQLGDDVRKQNLHPGYAVHQTTLQYTFVTFDQHRARSQRHRQEEDDPGR